MNFHDLEVRWLESRLKAQRRTQPATVFYGSSSIRLWTSLKSDFPGTSLINLGFGGSTLEDCSHYFTRLIPPANPRSILVYAGDNDLGLGETPQTVLRSYLSLMEQADRLLPGVPVCFLAIKPSPARWAIEHRLRMANELIRQAAQGRGPHAFLDVFPAMLGPDGQPRPEFYEDDGLHLSPEGYQLWAEFLRSSPSASVLFP